MAINSLNAVARRGDTLDSLLTELKARLGFVTQGVASKQIDPILTSFLQEGQEYVYEQLGAPMSIKRTTIQLAKSSKFYDFHNDEEDEDIDPQNVLAIDVYETETSIRHLHQGITEAMRADDTSESVPLRYDTTSGQIELWPTPDQSYPMVVKYQQGLPRFSQPADRPGIDSRLVFLYALASAKAHYLHQDAQTAGSIFQQQLAAKKQKRLENRRFVVGRRPVDERYFVKRHSDGTYTL